MSGNDKQHGHGGGSREPESTRNASAAGPDDTPERRAHREEIARNEMTGDFAEEQRHDPTGDANRHVPHGESAKRAAGIGRPQQTPSFANTNIANTEEEQTATIEAESARRLADSGAPTSADPDDPDPASSRDAHPRGGRGRRADG